MVKGHIESGFHIGVALKAERGLRSFQKLRFFGAGVNAVAAQATHARFSVRRTIEVGMRSGVATQTGLIQFRGGRFAGVENPGNVAAGLNVRLARAMARFTGDPGLAMLQCQLRVRIGGESFRFRHVASGANLLPNEVGGAYRPGFDGCLGHRLFGGRLTKPWPEDEENNQAKPNASNDASHTLTPRSQLTVPNLLRQRMSRIDLLGEQFRCKFAVTGIPAKSLAVRFSVTATIWPNRHHHPGKACVPQAVR